MTVLLALICLFTGCASGEAGETPGESSAVGAEAAAQTESEEAEDEAGTATSEEAVETETEAPEELTADRQLVIELDPGHGGRQSGAANEHVAEKTLNLKIAEYLKEELETYGNVSVAMTRTDDTEVELERRVEKAVEDQADVLISIHINASGDIVRYDHGCTVLVPRGVYEPELSRTAQELGCYILYALSDYGLENQGLMFRLSQNGGTYPNGELTDYYNIVKNGVLSGIPAIIIEHGFIDQEEEFEAFFSTDDKLAALAKADARGIASYYGLHREEENDSFLLENYEEKITVVMSDHAENDYIFSRTYFVGDDRLD